MAKKDIYRARYQYYRERGYSPDEARRLRSHALDLGEHIDNKESRIKENKPVRSHYTKEPEKIEKQSKADIYKIRYKIYRELGYSAQEARKMRSKELDVSTIKLKNDKTVPVKSKAFQEVKNEKKADIMFEKYKNKMDVLENDTVFTRWGMLTRDKRYRDDTSRLVKRIQKNHHLTNEQAYYFVYIMYTNGLSYKQAQKELLTNKEFEIYQKDKIQYHKRKKHHK